MSINADRKSARIRQTENFGVFWCLSLTRLWDLQIQGHLGKAHAAVREQTDISTYSKYLRKDIMVH